MTIARGHRVSLRLRHPSCSVKDLTDKLGLKPEYAWDAGEPRKTPKGTVLEGVRPDTYWCYTSSIVHQRMSEVLHHFLEILERERTWLDDFVTTGGKVEFYIWLVDDVSVGDLFAATMLKRLGELGVDLSFELVCHTKAHHGRPRQ